MTTKATLGMFVTLSAFALVSCSNGTGPQAAGESPVEERTVIKTDELHRAPEGMEEPDGPILASAALDLETGEITTGNGTIADMMTMPHTGNFYQIGAGDVLLFRSFDDPTLDTQVTVRFDGYISLPLVPDVNVRNATRAEATDRLREAYSEYFTEPYISLSILSVNSKSFTVLGDVSNPGTFPYTRPITILDAITSAGGKRIDRRGGDSFVGQQGQLTSAVIIRKTETERFATEFDITGLINSGPHPSETPVFPGDIVYVPEGRNLVYVLGEAGRNDVVELTEGMTLLQLMTIVGGVNESRARMSQVVLMHQIDEENTEVELVDLRKTYRGGYNPLLSPGDVIYVPRKRFTRMSDFVGQFTSTFSPLFDLYGQAWDVWYTDDRFRNTFGGSGNSSDLLQVQSLLQTLGGLTPNN